MCLLLALYLCYFFLHIYVLSPVCPALWTHRAWLGSSVALSRVGTPRHPVSVSAVSPCFSAAAVRMSRLNNSFDLRTLAQELQGTELPDEIEERLSSPGQVEGDWITMHKSDCHTLRCRTACLRELLMPGIQEEQGVYAYPYLHPQTHTRGAHLGATDVRRCFQ